MARSDFRQASGLCQRPHPVADRRRRVRVYAPRPRSLSQGRLPDGRRHDPAARRRARGGRDRDHRQDRRSGQHHQRHRRAAIDLVRRRLAGHHLVPAREGRRHRGAGSARPGQPRAAAAAQDDRAADGREVRSRRGAGPDARGLGATSRCATSPSTPTRRCGASSKASTASARCSSRRPRAADQHHARRRAAARLRPDRHRCVARAAVAERRDPGRAGRTGRARR